MSKKGESDISQKTVAMAIEELYNKRAKISYELDVLDKELQNPEAAATQEKLRRKEILIRQIGEIDAGIEEIKRAKVAPVMTGGGCAG